MSGCGSLLLVLDDDSCRLALAEIGLARWRLESSRADLVEPGVKNKQRRGKKIWTDNCTTHWFVVNPLNTMFFLQQNLPFLCSFIHSEPRKVFFWSLFYFSTLNIKSTVSAHIQRSTSHETDSHQTHLSVPRQAKPVLCPRRPAIFPVSFQ